ncbi:MAG: helix-turn-helix domain-containing protein [Halobacteriovoraceae bacterium]|jgi:excisionase family DNA binding protein|nr:helix-turn-helix domain-containing protein [Halobacteriovoraceae bacterium]
MKTLDMTTFLQQTPRKKVSAKKKAEIQTMLEEVCSDDVMALFLAEVWKELKNKKDSVLIVQADDEYKERISVSDVSEILSMSRPTINRLFDTGVLSGIVSGGGHRRFDLNSVKNYLAKLEKSRNAKLEMYSSPDEDDLLL